MGHGGIAVGDIRVYIKFIVDSDPTLQIWGEKKVIRNSKNYIPIEKKAIRAKITNVP